MSASQQNEPELRELLRRVLRGICIVATFFSAFFAAHSLLMTAQLLDDEIPAGKIQAIIGPTKSGLRLRLDNDEEVVFRNSALFDQPAPIELAVGDYVEKHRDSFEYFVNGKAITDQRWALRNWLLPVRLLIPLGVYLLVGTLYVLQYRRTPFGDLAWADADPKRPRRPRSRFGMILVMFLSWLAVALLMTMFYGCVGSCLSGIGKTLVSKE